MTDNELDSMMQQILLDAIALDEERCEDKIPFEPSLKYQHQTALMLKDPIRWEKNRSRPVWKKYGQRVAAILLVAYAVQNRLRKAAGFQIVTEDQL